MSLLKGLAGALSKPYVLVLLIAVAGAACHLIGRSKTARILLLGAATMAYLFATPVVGNALLEPLEQAYPPLRLQTSSGCEYVAVLGSGYAPADGLPVTAALDPDGLARIVEGVVLDRRLHCAHLLVSGGAPPGSAAPAHGYAELARELGVSEGAIIMSDHALDTANEARSLVSMLGNKSFVLVTSAYHMPRAMRLMRKAGASAIPAPVGGDGKNMTQTITWRSFVPNSGGLRDSERALHEYVGIAAVALGFE